MLKENCIAKPVHTGDKMNQIPNDKISDMKENNGKNRTGTRTVPVDEAVGTVLSHDITEIRPDDFKGRAFKKGHIIKEEDISHLKRLGKENLYILEMQDDEMHENDAAVALATAL